MGLGRSGLLGCVERWWTHQRWTVDHTWGSERGPARFGRSLALHMGQAAELAAGK